MHDALLVGTGAALGALARFLLSALFGLFLGAALWPLLTINIAGSALMGYLNPGKFWGTGVLGGFTSFSSFALLSAELPANWTAIYITATLCGCVGAFLLGKAMSRAW